MHRRLRPTTTASVETVPRSERRKTFRHLAGDGGPNSTIDRVTCSVCNFPGVAITTMPGENFPTQYVTTGSTYVWTNANDPLSVIDLTVTPVTNPRASCPFCGATLFVGGSRGQGQ